MFLAGPCDGFQVRADVDQLKSKASLVNKSL